MNKITSKEEADFVKLLIDRDLDSMNLDSERLNYLKIIGAYIDDVGEQILSASSHSISEPILGEDRPENSPDDIEILSLSALTRPIMKALNEIIRDEYDEKYEGSAKTPIEFIVNSKCLTGDDAVRWFDNMDLPHTFEHIHVYEDTWYAVIDSADDDAIVTVDNECSWRDASGKLHQSDMIGIARLIFNEAYLPSLKKVNAQEE